MAEENEGDEQPVPDTGAVFTFGKSRFADNAPNRFWIRNDQILQTACGDEHTLLLTKSGRVFSFGANDWGQLGHANAKAYTKPTSIKALKGKSAYLIACGRNHSLIALDDRTVVACGQNNDGELGVGDNEQHDAPVGIQDLDGLQIQQLSGGAHHSAALTSDGRLFMWGNNVEGQLGIPHVGEATAKPIQLEFPEKVRFVSCGYYHNAIITGSGNLYTFGEGECGKLGYPIQHKETVPSPRPVDEIQDDVLEVACGGRHTIAVTYSGTVYVFGDNSDGQLGLGQQISDTSKPQVVQQLSMHKIMHVSCGESHTAAISDHHQLFVWGNDQYGKLGLLEDSIGENGRYFHPQSVEKFFKFDVSQVSCGGCHTIALAHPNPNWEQRELKKIQHTQNRRALPPLRENRGETSVQPWTDFGTEDKSGHGPAETEHHLPKLRNSISVVESNDGKPEGLNARARRRQSTMTNVPSLRPASLADRAISISADVDRSLMGTSYDKQTINDIWHDTALIKSYENAGAGEKSDDEDSTGTYSKPARPREDGRKTSHTELLHKEMNRSLTVFRSSVDDEPNPNHSLMIKIDPKTSVDTSASNDEHQMHMINNRNSVYARQSVPMHSIAPTKITSVAQKYAHDSGDSMSSIRKYTDIDHNGHATPENGQESSFAKEIIRTGIDEDDDEGIQMDAPVYKRRVSDQSEIVEAAALDLPNTSAFVDQPMHGARPAFTAGPDQMRNQAQGGAMKRLTNLISRAKVTRSNGIDPGSSSSSAEQKNKSKACIIL